MRFGPLFPAAGLALMTLVPIACSSFESESDAADAGPNGGVDGAAEASPGPDVDAGRASKLYVFGGVTIVGQYEEAVFEAYAASILEDGSLGSWERAPALDVIRSYMTTIAAPGELLVMAGGNGMPIGQDASGDYKFRLEDVSVTGGDPLDPWKPAPALGPGNGRWAAAGTFASGRAYVGGGIVNGDVFTNNVMAAPVAIPPPTLQGWQSAGTLPVAVADHGLVGLGSRLYVFGGSEASEGGTVRSAKTSMTTIAADGTLGPWTPTADLPQALSGFGVVAADTRVFVIGGDNGTDSGSSSVFVGSQTATQDLVWTETAPLGEARHHPCVLRANGRLYVIGGSSISKLTATVEVGEVSGPNITWRPTTPLPGTRSALGCAAR